MTLDVPLLRSDTRGVANVLHFNNAGSPMPPHPVLEAVTSHLARERPPRPAKRRAGRASGCAP